MKDVVDIFKALSDPTRLRILMLLLKRDLCVCELIFILKMEQSRISHQLRILKYAGLVEDNRDGRWMVYSITEKKRGILETLLMKSFGKELGKSTDIKQDLKNLDRCIRENLRNI